MVLGDGKVYVALEEVPAHIPYQRALILFDEGKQTLVLQSKVETGEAAESAGPLAWVVPLPSVPELDSFPATFAYPVFFFLGMRSQPNVISIRTWIPIVMLFGSAGLFLFFFLRGARMAGLDGCRGIRRRNEICMMVSGVVFLLLMFGIPAFSLAGEGVDAEVVKAEQVGIHEVRVIRSDDSSALLEWLTTNGFAFSQDDLPVLDRYVERGWCFVVSKVGAADVEAHQVQGLIDPLVMRFESERPVYPLALTATQGLSTQVLVYLLADRKMVGEGPLKLRYARRLQDPFFEDHEGLMPGLQSWERELAYLHRFRSKLSPKDMLEDAIFVPAEDDEPVRETVVRW